MRAASRRRAGRPRRAPPPRRAPSARSGRRRRPGRGTRRREAEPRQRFSPPAHEGLPGRAANAIARSAARRARPCLRSWIDTMELRALYACLLALATAALLTPVVARLATRIGAVDELKE